MYKIHAAEYFGSQAALARAIGCTRQHVSQWPEIVPELWAWKIQGITRGKVKVDRSLYEEQAA